MTGAFSSCDHYRFVRRLDRDRYFRSDVGRREKDRVWVSFASTIALAFG